MAKVVLHSVRDAIDAALTPAPTQALLRDVLGWAELRSTELIAELKDAAEARRFVAALQKAPSFARRCAACFVHGAQLHHRNRDRTPTQQDIYIAIEALLFELPLPASKLQRTRWLELMQLAVQYVHESPGTAPPAERTKRALRWAEIADRATGQ